MLIDVAFEGCSNSVEEMEEVAMDTETMTYSELKRALASHGLSTRGTKVALKVCGCFYDEQTRKVGITAIFDGNRNDWKLLSQNNNNNEMKKAQRKRQHQSRKENELQQQRRRKKAKKKLFAKPLKPLKHEAVALLLQHQKHQNGSHGDECPPFLSYVLFCLVKSIHFFLCQGSFVVLCLCCCFACVVLSSLL